MLVENDTGLLVRNRNEEISVPGAPSRCPTCGQLYRRGKRPVTRGHLRPASAAVPGGTRYWMRQCAPCNNAQGDLTLSEWSRQRAQRGRSHALLDRLIAWLRDNGHADET